jgi:hypothetical protein
MLVLEFGFFKLPFLSFSTTTKGYEGKYIGKRSNIKNNYYFCFLFICHAKTTRIKIHFAVLEIHPLTSREKFKMKTQISNLVRTTLS